MSSRPYELIVFGATGFTGKYTCEHIVSQLPTDLKWAVAGRSESKLQSLVQELKSLNPDRLAPEIVTSGLDKQSVNELAKKTTVLINTVGPYMLYAEPVVEACAQNGTHYLDVTGETPWVREMIKKYHSTAKANKAIIIHQIGVESAPADLLSWSMVQHARRTLSAGISELVFSVADLKGQPSGGTLATVMMLFDKYSISETTEAMKPWSLCPTTPPRSSLEGPTLFQRLFGVRQVRDLGTLSTSIQGATDTTIVHRSWGLFENGNLYGPKFRFSPYMHVRNMFTGILVHFAIAFGMIALVLSPIRSLLKRFVFQPGEGPSRESSRRDRIEYRAIATVDSADPNDPKRITGRMAWDGSLYYLTGVFLAEAAITILRDETPAVGMGGGSLTPAALGAPFLERLQKAGLRTDVKVMP
ncbi:hypothetical protein KCU81_g9117, partial [Aureobasidium melanogenum]|uniref:Saccharopine dehydrogenase NADP binding domain-containing protein n=1 Tax=Aureobasidium melanogenum (strain CBS 110374) TaxID=1043003 RepID=A0A074W6R6_AURM1